MAGDWRRGADPAAIEQRLRDDTGARHQGGLRRPQRDLDRRDQPHRRRAPGDRRGRPSGPADGRHHLLARLDRLPPRRMGRRRHRRRLAEGPDAAARPVFNAICEKALAASKTAKLPQRATGTGTRCWPPTPTASSPTRRPPTCSTACARRCDMLLEEGLDERLRAPRAPRRGDARARCAPGASRSCAATRATIPPSLTAVVMPEGHDADAFRKVVAGAISTCRSARPGQARRQGVPHRPSRRLQRPDADGRPERRRDGFGPRRRPAQARRRASRPHLSPRHRPRRPTLITLVIGQRAGCARSNEHD